jgi:hypothetical protein
VKNERSKRFSVGCLACIIFCMAPLAYQKTEISTVSGSFLCRPTSGWGQFSRGIFSNQLYILIFPCE